MTKRRLIVPVLLALLLPAAVWAAAPDLPPGTLVEYPVPGASNDTLVEILSGDGGWADLDRQLGQIIAGRNYSVLGFDCYKYFDRTRSPEETARDFISVLKYYQAAWHKEKVVLIGFSFGAAVLPFILSRLPEDLSATVDLVVLLSAARYANWEIHWGDWMHDQPHKSARSILPEMAKAKPRRLLCIYGHAEADQSLCTELSARDGESLELPGDHHFDGDYDHLASLILQRVRP
jgi:type IV secretory pathway VirJ component